MSDTERLGDAIILFGDFATTGRQEDNEELLVVLGRLANRVHRVRMIGSAAADFAFIACGRANGLIMSNAHQWDIEAGRLLLNEAGGATDGAAILGTHQYGLGGNREISKKLWRLVRPNSTVE